jgi:hypothetical protein
MKNAVNRRVKTEKNPPNKKLKVKKASFDGVLSKLIQSAPLTREAAHKRNKRQLNGSISK